MNVYTIFVSDHISLPVTMHTHNYYQFIYCQKGVGAIQIGNNNYSAVPGRAYLVKPMEEHGIMPMDSLRLIEVKFTVEGEAFEKSLSQLPSEFEIDEYLSLRLSFKEVAKEGLSQRTYSNEATNSALKLFLIRLLRKHDVEAVESKSHSVYFDTPHRRSSPEDRDVEFVQVIDYIEKHLSESITLDDLASLAHFEKSYLTVRFKEIWGISPMKYVNWMRVERAKVLLATTDMSITDISREVGFGSIHYFSRYFKEKENMTPNEYRTERQRGI
ncbi:MAG: helix-turn-helix domain-containing protein [Ruminococcaceae bacterium]|nr:helix-turn-helix domain-containing protein [Oscillospiraceae bacterium]